MTSGQIVATMFQVFIQLPECAEGCATDRRVFCLADGDFCVKAIGQSTRQMRYPNLGSVRGTVIGQLQLGSLEIQGANSAATNNCTHMDE